jgi:hypothetical protein
LLKLINRLKTVKVNENVLVADERILHPILIQVITEAVYSKI